MAKHNGKAVDSNPASPPYVHLVLDKPRRLLFDFNALIALGDEIKENMLSEGAWDKVLGIERDKKDPKKVLSINPTPRNFRALLWSALLADDPELTVQQTGALIHAGNFTAIMEALSKAQNAQADIEQEAVAPRPTVAANVVQDTQ